MIFPIQGVITTRKDLDREAPGLAVDADGRGVYTLKVDAADHGSPKQRTTATVIIKQLQYGTSGIMQGPLGQTAAK